MYNQIVTMLNQIKREKPLILNITNYVTMDFIANGLLSLGASPVMSTAEHEIDDLLKIAKVIVINLGTLNHEFLKLCEKVCLGANQVKKPIVLDPVGAGASLYRTEAAKKLIHDYQIAIVRGNASEIADLSGLCTTTKGVDSAMDSHAVIENARKLSLAHDLCITMSGQVDVMIDHDEIYRFNGGSSLMPSITGTGCLLSSIVGAFHAVCSNRFLAASAATVFYGKCGEIAASQVAGPGSFKTQFLDTLYTMPERGHYGEC